MSTKRPWRGQPGDVGICSFSGRRREQRHSFPWWRAGRRIFRFCSAAGPRASGTHFLKKEQFPFPPGFSGPWHDSVQRPASSLSPTNHFASSQESTVRGWHSSPRTSGQSRLGPREFGEDASERTAFCTIHPYFLSLHLHVHVLHVDCAVGAACTASGGVAHAAQPVSLAHADNSTRYAIQFARRPPKFNAVLETLVAVRNAPVLREEIAVLLDKDAIEPVPPAERRQGFTALTSSYPRNVVAFVQSLICEFWTGLYTSSRSRCGRSGRIIKCIQPKDWFAAIDLKDAYFHVSILLRRRPSKVGHGSTGSCHLGLTLSPCVFHEGRRRRPYPVTGGGCQDTQLPWRLAYPSPIQRAVGRSQGLGAPALQPVGASGQLGKEQALACAENLFSRCGVRLGEYDGTPHGGTCPSSAELPEFLQRQECGTTETVSEAPGAYGIRSCSHAARFASYETTSALATLPGPEVGMAPWYTASGYHPAVLPLPQPLDGPCLSMGRGAPITSVPAYCLSQQMPPARAGALHATGRQPRGSGQGPDWFGTINCLELWAVHLALRQFRPLLLGKHVLVRTWSALVCHGGQQKGKPVSKQRLAHWIVEAVALAYQSQGEPVPPGGEGSLHQECCLLPCVGARRLFGRHLQSCGLVDTEHLHKILQSPRWASFLPVCWVSNGREELAGVMLAAPFPLTPGIRAPFFSPSSVSPGRWTLGESSKHPRQSDWAEQSDARPSTGVSSPGSPVSPCTGLGVRMALIPPLGNPICVFFQGKVSLV